MSDCDREASINGGHGPLGAVARWEQIIFVHSVYHEGLKCAFYIACHSMCKGINFPEFKAAGN